MALPCAPAAKASTTTGSSTRQAGSLLSEDGSAARSLLPETALSSARQLDTAGVAGEEAGGGWGSDTGAGAGEAG